MLRWRRISAQPLLLLWLGNIGVRVGICRSLPGLWMGVSIQYHTSGQQHILDFAAAEGAAGRAEMVTWVLRPRPEPFGGMEG